MEEKQRISLIAKKPKQLTHIYKIYWNSCLLHRGQHDYPFRSLIFSMLEFTLSIIAEIKFSDCIDLWVELLFMTNTEQIVSKYLLMHSPKSTADNSNSWKLWHGFNYFLGGGTFLVGSLLLFSVFSTEMDVPEISGWLYTLGSATFTLGDITEWMHFVYADCRFKSLAINYFLNVCASVLYLIGSACFIPELGYLEFGMNLFIWGSGLIVLAQTWKLLRTFTQKGKSCKQCYKQDVSGFWVDLVSNVGGLMYLVGTIIFQKTSEDPSLSELAALIYSLGGLCFFMSAFAVLIKYFCGKSQPKSQLGTDYSLLTNN